ncbi:MAG: hypothetical protein QG670_141 [Thermoproteota archaeon]|nr:hypothetical protein [Thermoproteota archaeon]
MSVKLITVEDIRRLRKIAGLTQKELSKKAGVSQSLIARIENNSVDPRLSTVKKIVQAIVIAQGERTAKDVMNSPVITINVSDNVRRAIELMKKHDISQIPVIKDSKNIGSIQESSLVDRIVRSSNPDRFFNTSIYEVMGERFKTVDPITNISDILILLSLGEPAILVLEHEKIIGIITKIDVLSSIIHFET